MIETLLLIIKIILVVTGILGISLIVEGHGNGNNMQEFCGVILSIIYLLSTIMVMFPNIYVIGLLSGALGATIVGAIIVIVRNR